MTAVTMVSIGLPYTDQGEELSLAIKSVLAQTHQDWELILAGDGPSPETSRIARRFEDPRIRVVESAERIGLAATLNRIAEDAQHPLLARMDADDIMRPDRIEILCGAFQSDPTLDLVGSNAYLIDDDSELIGAFVEHALPTSGEGFLRSNAFSHPTVMGRTEWFLRNPYNEELLRGQDKELWLRTWASSKFCKLPDRLMYYRVSRLMSSQRLRRNEAYNRRIMSMYSHYESSSLSRFSRIFSSYLKEFILSFSSRPSIANRLYDRKWVELEQDERESAQQYLTVLLGANVCRVTDEEVAAVTVTYGSRHEMVQRTVEAALAAGASEAIVVDNGSEPRSRDALDAWAQSDRRISLLRFDNNEGSAPAFARGINAFLASSREYLWLLDDDNKCQGDTLEALLSVLQQQEALSSKPQAVLPVRSENSHHQAVLAGARVENVYPKPGSFMYFDIVAFANKKLRQFKSARPNQHVKNRMVPYGPYGGLLIGRQSIGQIGLPNKKLGLYEDDTEYTSRITRMGGQVLLCLDARIEEIDQKWSRLGNKNGLAGLVHSHDSARAYFAVRNRVHFDASRITTRTQALRFGFNRFIFTVAARSLTLVHSGPTQLPVILKAIRDGADGNLSISFSTAIDTAG